MDIDQRTWLRRSDYVDSDQESRYLTRDSEGRPNLQLRRVDDRLAIWATTPDGGFINPRGVGIRRFGLVTTQVRGTDYAPQSAHFRAADLRAGASIELLREPQNPHDSNAIAMQAGGRRIGHVQRGRAGVVARRMDAGENWSGVSLHGPMARSIDEPCRILLGRDEDLRHMLHA